MANFAVINGNKVVNIIVAETLEDAEINVSATCVEITDDLTPKPSLGWSWDGNVFSNVLDDPIVE
jgi:hypothetical protein